MTHRTNESYTQAQMISCIDCGDLMCGIYGKEAREICWECGGEIRHEKDQRKKKA